MSDFRVQLKHLNAPCQFVRDTIQNVGLSGTTELLRHYIFNEYFFPPIKKKQDTKKLYVNIKSNSLKE